MTPELLASVLAIALSLLFRFVPALQSWFDTKTSEYKQAFMLAGLLVITAVIFALSCAGLAPVLGLTVVCTVTGAIELLTVFIAAATANQSTFWLTKRPSSK